MNEFLKTADSRGTSPEIMEAILFCAGGDEINASIIWEDPTKTEILAILGIVTKNDLHDAKDFYWGAAGSNWSNV